MTLYKDVCRGIGCHTINFSYEVATTVRDRGLSNEKEFDLGRLNMDEPITRARGKRFQEELGERLNSLMEEREEEAKLMNFSQLLKYYLFLFLIIFWAYFWTCNELPQSFIVIFKTFNY